MQQKMASSLQQDRKMTDALKQQTLDKSLYMLDIPLKTKGQKDIKKGV